MELEHFEVWDICPRCGNRQVEGDDCHRCDNVGWVFIGKIIPRWKEEVNGEQHQSGDDNGESD